ncbi:MAG TPA: histidinol-phosphatase [Gaiellaceae bacterium]|nr:histidinol-phosphatase [Gaiellaceae bacterium]
MSPDLGFALALADVADEITMRHFRSDSLAVETKPDLTPVSVADRAAEEALREAIGRERPDEAVVGEELGEAGGEDGAARWILDPIDGTKHYVRGIPLWATLIALEREGAVVLGVASAPALGLRWWAERGAGAFANGAPIRVSSVATLEEAAFTHAGSHSFEKRGLGPALRGLTERVWMERAYGDFWQHMLVAEGRLDFAVEAVVNLWDLAAVQPIVEEAGGRFTDFAGRPLPDGGNAVSSNGLLHDDVLGILASA